MKKLMIVDGSSMLVTNYYATLPNEIKFAKSEEEKAKYYSMLMQTSKGKYTNGVYGMLRMIKNIMHFQKPDYMCFCFDKTRNTFRREMFPDYKAQRSASPEPLKEQFITIENVLKEIGFPVLFSENYEADDYAGSIAEKYKNEEDLNIYLWTKDHDYLQLVDDNVFVIMPCMKKQYEKWMDMTYYEDGIDANSEDVPLGAFMFNPAYVKKIEGVWPYQIPDLKGLKGDTSDNIPGVKGIAETSAVPLLNEYETIEAIYDEIETNDLNSLKARWKEELGLKRSPIPYLTATSEDNIVGKNAAILSKTLATIKTDIPVSETLQDMSCNIDWIKWNNVLQELEITTI